MSIPALTTTIVATETVPLAIPILVGHTPWGCVEEGGRRVTHILQ